MMHLEHSIELWTVSNVLSCLSPIALHTVSGKECITGAHSRFSSQHSEGRRLSGAVHSCNELMKLLLLHILNKFSKIFSPSRPKQSPLLAWKLTPRTASFAPYLNMNGMNFECEHSKNETSSEDLLLRRLCYPVSVLGQ